MWLFAINKSKRKGLQRLNSLQNLNNRTGYKKPAQMIRDDQSKILNTKKPNDRDATRKYGCNANKPGGDLRPRKHFFRSNNNCNYYDH